MEKKRYRKDFKSGIAALIFCILLFGSITLHSIIADIQYKELIADMSTTEAVITDARTGGRRKSRYQKITIEYTVGTEKYERPLGTDTKLSGKIGLFPRFKEGDTVEIYYNPSDPSVIATELTVRRGRAECIFGITFLLISTVSMIYVIKKRDIYKITESEYREEREKAQEKKTREKTRYDGTSGYKIRAQYFNAVLFVFLCIYAMVISILVINTLMGAEGTKLESFAEVISLLLVVAVFASPFIILSLLNRRFFGKVICLINADVIKYYKANIRWDDVEEIRYTGSVITPAEGVVIICRDKEIKIRKAPFMMLGKIRKYNKNVKISISKKAVFIPIIIIAVLVMLSVVITM